MYERVWKNITWGIGLAWSAVLVFSYFFPKASAQHSGELVVASGDNYFWGSTFNLPMGNLQSGVTYYQNASNVITARYQLVNVDQLQGTSKNLATISGVIPLDFPPFMFTLADSWGNVYEDNGQTYYQQINSNGNTQSSAVTVGVGKHPFGIGIGGNSSIICRENLASTSILCQRYDNLAPGINNNQTSGSTAYGSITNIGQYVFTGWQNYLSGLYGSLFDTVTGQITVNKALLVNSSSAHIISAGKTPQGNIMMCFDDFSVAQCQFLNNATLSQIGSQIQVSVNGSFVKFVIDNPHAIFTYHDSGISHIKTRIYNFDTQQFETGEINIDLQGQTNLGAWPAMLSDGYFSVAWNRQLSNGTNQVVFRVMDKYVLLNQSRPTAGVTTTAAPTSISTSNQPSSSTSSPTFFSGSTSSSSSSNMPIILSISIIGGVLFTFCIIGGVLYIVKSSKGPDGKDTVEMKKINVDSDYAYKGEEKEKKPGTPYVRISGVASYKEKQDSLSKTPNPHSLPSTDRSIPQYANTSDVLKDSNNQQYANTPPSPEKTEYANSSGALNYADYSKFGLNPPPMNPEYANSTLVSNSNQTHYANSSNVNSNQYANSPVKHN